MEAMLVPVAVVFMMLPVVRQYLTLYWVIACQINEGFASVPSDFVFRLARVKTPLPFDVLHIMSNECNLFDLCRTAGQVIFKTHS